MSLQQEAGRRETLQYIVNHVFLPPQLPQNDNDETLENEVALVEECHTALLAFIEYIPPCEHTKWTACSRMLNYMLKSKNPSGILRQGDLDNSFLAMKIGDSLPFYFRGQNAGLVLRKLPERYLFESFELSPTSASVMSTKGRLIRSFPGPAIAIGHDRIQDSSFRKALAQLLVNLDAHTPKEAWATAFKASSRTDEIRDTLQPIHVTEMFMGILRGVGEPFDIIRISKRTRDDVLWSQTLKPWRRSAVWLLIRVVLQTSLMKDGKDHTQYKCFMIFFMARILQSALQYSFGSDTLHIMAAKISKREMKLSLPNNPPWLFYVQNILRDNQQELAERWSKFETDTDPLGIQNKWKSATVQWSSDITLSMVSLQAYLSGIETRQSLPAKVITYQPACNFRVRNSPSHFPQLTSHIETSTWLIDVEHWTERCLSDWLNLNITSEKSCTLLAGLIEIYAMTATECYQDKPEDLSLMFLTVMDLWVAFDKLVIKHQDLFVQYDTGFLPSLFDPILLPKRRHMDRLAEVQKHIEKRTQNSIHTASYIFQEVNSKDSFGVCYFNKSEYHQTLLQDIVAAATIERDRKKTEFVAKSKEYHNLIERADLLSCKYLTRWTGYENEEYHSPTCEKCKLNNRAKALSINVHEWPLPKHPLEAKSAVFELNVPVTVSKWRDTTFFLLTTIFSPPLLETSRCQTHYLRKFEDLRAFVNQEDTRLQFASKAKSFTASHYSSKKISVATESTICVNHGLKYLMCDSTKDLYTNALLGRCDVREKCTFRLPPGSYDSLQFALNSTTHTPNEVLALQYKCSKELGLHEFYNFAIIRSGHRTQWINVAIELGAHVLNFSHEETHMLMVQAAWQVGPLGNSAPCRESHFDLTVLRFGLDFVSVLESSLASIEANWQGCIAVRTFVVLAVRLLSVSCHHEVHMRCHIFLRHSREVTLRWIRELRGLIESSENPRELAVLNLRALEIALTCHETFNVEENHLDNLLTSPEDVADIIQCSIIIHDRCPASTKDLDKSLQLLLSRHHRLSHFLEPHLRNRITKSPDGINHSIRRMWRGFRGNSGWTALPNPSEKWLKTTMLTEDGTSMTIHYNVLNGSLLINGTSLTRLPRLYEVHDTYQRLFGTKIMDVVPSTMNGMVFESRNELYGQRVHFRMQNAELIIRIQSKHQTCEVIPLTALTGDFPSAFIREHIYFLDVKTKELELRPLSRLWTSSPENWKIAFDQEDFRVLKCLNKQLIDIRSNTATSISSLLSPIEKPQHIHIFLDTQTHELEIQLPRFNLDFFQRDAQSRVESKQFRGMAIAMNQSFGAFTGLLNKLVLETEGSLSRSIIVPHGAVTFRRKENHVEVTIDTGSRNHARHHTYQIDTQLGRLIDTGTLESKLFKSYLHAVTSHCLVDMLTGRTGTEEALYVLNSSAARSFAELTAEDIEQLTQIMQLAPQRHFYPSHLKVMQEVEWTTLSPLSQHSGFYEGVSSILDHFNSLKMFQKTPVVLPDMNKHSNNFLLARAATRDGSFQVSGFGARDHNISDDSTYGSRERTSELAREQHTSCTARLVDQWSTHLTCSPNLWDTFQSWRSLSGPIPKRTVLLGFDTKWLDKPLPELMSEYWCTLHYELSNCDSEKDKYGLMIFLSTLSYSRHSVQNVVQTLLAFATKPSTQKVIPPQYSKFKLAEGCEPSRNTIFTRVKAHWKPFYDCPERNLSAVRGETYENTDLRRKNAYQAARDEQIVKMVDALMNQWPTPTAVTPPGLLFDTYITVEDVMRELQYDFQTWYSNFKLMSYATELQKILDGLSTGTHTLSCYSFSKSVEAYTPKQGYVCFEDLISNKPAPSLSVAGSGIAEKLTEFLSRSQVSSHQNHLKELLDRISGRAHSAHEQRYSADLQDSFRALLNDISTELVQKQELVSVLERNMDQAQKLVKKNYGMISEALEEGQSNLARVANMLPRLPPTAILFHLTHGKVEALPRGWKTAFIDYGLSIASLQRAERLLANVESPSDLIAEINNRGHQNWNPAAHPSWLLLEVENNLLIRPEQAEIARAMIEPSSGGNSVMQLNMGLGKSSVIVPIVAATLADGTRLTRVVVLKPLATQMFQLLVTKLGGLLNRRIVTMPISRALDPTLNQAHEIRELYEDCMRSGTIVLLQPEHILSFELMGLEQSLSSTPNIGKVMTETQDWLYRNTRDILDESDEILSVRFELIYTIGLQRNIDFSPDRWTIIETILGHIAQSAEIVAKEFLHGLEIIPSKPGGFPRIRVLRPQAGERLLDLVAHQICREGLPGISIQNFSKKIASSLLGFLTCLDFSTTAFKEIEETVFGSSFIKTGLLLLRGLFAGGVLRFVFEQKRWRVNYGLDPSRTMLAVPYHGKDSPALRSEFSHPDATIALTCLSYYYGGLTNDEVNSSFESLLQTDDPQVVYDQWVRDAPELPDAFKYITGVNLRNTSQCLREVFPPLRFAKGLIDFYLETIVFPKEMKEFPEKLSSSGWDIARENRHPVTGFSGTNDSRYILPLSIKQCDLPAQLFTNAFVMGCLLRPENSFIDATQFSPTGMLDADILLRMATEGNPPIRVILDVGAQILELQNEEVARSWLTRVTDMSIQAAVFFDADDNLCVLGRDGRKESLLTSPFAKQMNQCVVYLDESHTRGTDLKLPSDYRAIVTLGPGLTKDRLAQACMRMRKLGKGQSVVLCSSLEIHQKILEHTGKTGSIEVCDVLEWCIANTCAQTTKNIPLWATQGIRHQLRRAVYSESRSETETGRALLEPEAQSIQERYGNIGTHVKNSFLHGTNPAASVARKTQLDEIRDRCREFEITSFNSAALQEEQERELAPENEHEQQVEPPNPSEPLPHSLHRDVRNLITLGSFNSSSKAFKSAWEVFSDTTANPFYEAKWPKHLFVTTDFARVIETSPSKEILDEFLRPVRWILTSTKLKSRWDEPIFVVLSPFEVQELLPVIRLSRHATLHTYSPRLGMSLRSFEDLTFCAVPNIRESWSAPLPTIMQLNLFAGQLYLRTYEEYVWLCNFLGLSYQRQNDGVEVECDGFITPQNRFKTKSDNPVHDCTFVCSPVDFIRAVVRIRRKGQSFESSHMGKIINGELIQQNKF